MSNNQPLTLISSLPMFIVYHVMEFLELDYHEYIFYNKKNSRGLTIIKNPIIKNPIIKNPIINPTEECDGYILVNRDVKKKGRRQFN